MEAACVVQIALLASGEIKVNAQGGNPLLVLGLLAKAQQMLAAQDKAPQPGIQVAPANLLNRLPN